MCSSCSNSSAGSVSNTGNANNSNNNSGCSCRIAVTVEDNFAPCTFPERYFNVTVRSRDGSTTLTGRVAGGGSAIFTAPCGEYAVTVTGNEYSSPRAQTRRINCCSGQTAGVTFIFMTFEPDCPPKFCPPCPLPCPPGPPICPPPPCPPRPPQHYPQPHTAPDVPSPQIMQEAFPDGLLNGLGEIIAGG
ncbi:MAG: hypothetical protein NC395_10645 [Prevotella sp.]|nr:hypothetical protein [Prevotella sp.]